jgi:hypothetical protein
MIALSDNEIFRQAMALLKWGVPYECLFGPKKLWPRAWRNAATLVMNDFYSPDEQMGLE